MVKLVSVLLGLSLRFELFVVGVVIYIDFIVNLLFWGEILVVIWNFIYKYNYLVIIGVIGYSF